MVSPPYSKYLLCISESRYGYILHISINPVLGSIDLKESSLFEPWETRLTGAILCDRN